MKKIYLREKTNAAGLLHLDVPVGLADAECDIVVVVQPQSVPTGWLADFWERLGQGWQGEPLVRPPQGTYEIREPLR